MRGLCALCLAALLSRGAGAADHAVALLYHHVSGETPAVTSVAPDRFRAHLDYLADNGFVVLPLGEIVDALRAGRSVPDNAVAITFDDAYRSVYTEAFPLLRRRGLPFSVFVNSEAIDAGYNNYMTWEQLREVAAAGAEIGNHSHSHAHLVRREPGESRREWRKRVTAEVVKARERLLEEIPGAEGAARLFAYPYGEYNEALRNLVAAQGYTGIAQQSGAVGHHSDFLALPRFPMATGYASEERFATAVRARPLPVAKVEESILKKGQGLAEIVLHLHSRAPAAERVACYSAAGETLSARRGAGDDGSAIRLDVSGINTPGRNKINCTAPVAAEQGAFYWYSHQWLVRLPDGSWYRE